MNGIKPNVMAGHSLGEYSALVCAQSIKFSDALKIVSLRGKIMQKIADKRPSLMYAILGIHYKIIKHICATESTHKIASLASINSKTQVVISGDCSAVHQVIKKCKKLGAKRILNLHINVPAHSELMKPELEKIKNVLHNSMFQPPTIPIINNINAQCETTGDNIKKLLVKQLYHTINWKKCIEQIIEKKIFIMLEIGPKTILTNLNKRKNNIIALHTNTLKNFYLSFKKINKKI